MPNPVGIVKKGTQTPLAPGFVPPEVKRPHHPLEVASGEIRQINVDVTDDVVSVKAQADIYQTIPTTSYVWSLRIFENTRQAKMVSEHHYTDRAFTLPPGETSMQPTFADQFALPPGQYRVVLRLYSVGANWDWTAVKPGEDLAIRAGSTISRGRIITVSE